MTLFIGVCWIILAGSAVSGAHLHKPGPPHLHINTTQIIVEENNTLELACTGAHPMEWTFPENVRSRAHVTSYGCPGCPTALQHRSVLMVEQAEFNDTGSFQCFYSRHLGHLPNETATGTYVFVTSNDPNRLFADVHTGLFAIKEVMVYADEPFIIPCRVTNPNAQVTLETGQGLIALPIYGGKTHYDPRVGFHISSDQSLYHGIVWCEVHYGGVTANQYFIVIYEANTSLPEPRVYSSKIEVLQGREGFNIMCQAKSPLLSEMTLTWDYPGKTVPALQSNYRVNHTSEEFEGSMNPHDMLRSYRRLTSTLTVVEATPQDNGTYVCTASTREGVTSDDVTIYVLDRAYVRIDPLVKDNRMEIRKGSEKERIAFFIQAYPSAQYTWLKDNKEIMPDNPLYKFRPDLDDLAKAILRLLNIREEHAGRYTLMGRSGNVVVRKTVEIVVLVKPHIFVSTLPYPNNTKPPLFTIGQPYQLNCTASGYPTPNVTWLWSPCEQNDLICNPIMKNASQWIAVSDRLVAKLKSNEVILDTSSFRESGCFRCVARSSKFTKRGFWTDKEYKLTDVEGGLAISSDTLSPFENSKATLTCRASIYVFNRIQWSYNNNDNVTALIKRKDGINITTRTENFSKISVLMLFNLNMNDTGKYHCSAIQRDDGHNYTATTPLFVKELKPPVILNRPANLEVDKSNRIFMVECNATGAPLPKFKWYKDNHEIHRGFVNQNTADDYIVSQLTRDRITVGDSGVYKCVAINEGGSDENIANIYVQERPKIEVEQTTVLTPPGGNVTIQCQVSGVPHPVISWSRNITEGLEEIPYEFYDNDNQELELANVRAEDEGVYLCTAQNKLGIDQKNITLKLDTFSDVNECISQPCLNGATCTDEVDRFHCTCPQGIRGVRCEEATTVLSDLQIGMVIVGSAIAAACTIALILKCCFKTSPSDEEMIFQPDPSGSTPACHDKYNIRRTDLAVLDILLGSGAKGLVYKGQFRVENNKWIDVAVKTPKVKGRSIESTVSQ